MSRLSQSAGRKTKRTEQSIDQKQAGGGFDNSKKGRAEGRGRGLCTCHRGRIERRGEDGLGGRWAVDWTSSWAAAAAAWGFTESSGKISGAPCVARRRRGRRRVSIRIVFLPVSSTGRSRTQGDARSGGERSEHRDGKF